MTSSPTTQLGLLWFALLLVIVKLTNLLEFAVTGAALMLLDLFWRQLMLLFVKLQPSCSGVALAAPLVVADEGFLSSMGCLVSVKVTFRDELLVANLTNKRSSVLV